MTLKTKIRIVGQRFAVTIAKHAGSLSLVGLAPETLKVHRSGPLLALRLMVRLRSGSLRAQVDLPRYNILTTAYQLDINISVTNIYYDRRKLWA